VWFAILRRFQRAAVLQDTVMPVPGRYGCKCLIMQFLLFAVASSDGFLGNVERR
jgi:hypothetical protein